MREAIGENWEKLLKSWRLPPKEGELAGELIEIHRRSTEDEKLKSDIEMKERNDLMQMMREDVIKKFGLSLYPLPSCLEPAFDLQYREKVDEELYSANMPISPELLRKAVDICTDVLQQNK
ncbi:hypothetical protein AVEN_253368-1 [Araneus ventricosus]|uniref:Uncharacterized protein n=1 Tax=Araneus ventricosus TaxID=182803 RepID=A0A4Y2MT76_ARAVE|nr:hypothetical protein AVEN_253368-1 [Araneus ventricosus]